MRVHALADSQLPVGALLTRAACAPAPHFPPRRVGPVPYAESIFWRASPSPYASVAYFKAQAKAGKLYVNVRRGAGA